MGYTNAIFFLDYVNGNDAARTALTSVTVSNQSGVVKCTKTDHGLVTGAVVTLSLFDAWLNGDWKITRIDANNFTLDTSVWQSVIDGNGTVTPFGGSSWSDAWKTLNSGATAARIKGGDELRLAKSPAPYSVGNATWTNGSKTVTLATAQTAVIDNCETAWTGAGDTTITRDPVATDAKEGSYCMKLAVDASPQTGIKQAYFTISASGIDFSAYDRISFWLKNENAIADDNTWLVKLCSDTTGDVAVNTFKIPAVSGNGSWMPLTLAPEEDGTLGSAIKSIAIYSGTTAPAASKYIRVDHFIACVSGGLNLQSLISKNSFEKNCDETWWPIQSINGTTILLDGPPNTAANIGRGYAGTGETVATYCRETIKTTMATSTSSVVQEIMDSGSYNNDLIIKGGYNPSNGNQDGETWFDGLVGRGVGIYINSKSFIELYCIGMVRYYPGFQINSSNNLIISDCSFNGNVQYGVYFNNVAKASIEGTINCVSNTTGIFTTVCSNITATTLKCNSNIGYGISSDTNGLFKYLQTKNNGLNGIFATSAAPLIIEFESEGNNSYSIAHYATGLIIQKANIDDSLVILSYYPYSGTGVYITNNVKTGYPEIWTGYGKITGQAATAGGTGIEWKMMPVNASRNIDYPLRLKVATVAVNANAQVTAKLYFKKSHASDIGAKLICRGLQISGVTTGAEATAPSDTNRNQVTLTFTPTEAGVVEIEALAYWLANAADENVIVDDFTITQA